MSFGKYLTISVLIICITVLLGVERCSQKVFRSPDAVHRDNMNALASCIERIGFTHRKNGKKTTLEEAKQICENA